LATEVFTTETIRLLDETEVDIRPLAIAKLRKFTRIWQDHLKEVRKQFQAAEEGGGDALRDLDLTDAQYDVLIKLCAFGLDSIKEDRTDKQFAAYLEDVLDEQTVYRILNVTGGLSLGEENTNLILNRE
jgi:hypothetical protein